MLLLDELPQVDAFMSEKALSIVSNDEDRDHFGNFKTILTNRDLAVSFESDRGLVGISVGPPDAMPGLYLAALVSLIDPASAFTLEDIRRPNHARHFDALQRHYDAIVHLVKRCDSREKLQELQQRLKQMERALRAAE